MARNRRNQSGAIRFVPAVKAFLICVLIGGSAVGYVLQKNKIYELGRQMTNREAALEKLKWENKIRANQLADLTSPTRLAQRVQELRLGLVLPQQAQIVWLPEPPRETDTNQASRLLVLGSQPNR